MNRPSTLFALLVVLLVSHVLASMPDQEPEPPFMPCPCMTVRHLDVHRPLVCPCMAVRATTRASLPAPTPQELNPTLKFLNKLKQNPDSVLQSTDRQEQDMLVILYSEFLFKHAPPTSTHDDRPSAPRPWVCTGGPAHVSCGYGEPR